MYQPEVTPTSATRLAHSLSAGRRVFFPAATILLVPLHARRDPGPVVASAFRAWVILLGGVATTLAAEQLQNFPAAEFVPTAYNDGDSFRVRLENEGKAEEHVIRLYFVDTFESILESDTDRRRLLEQTREFGFAKNNREQGVQFGKRAGERVTELLARPFTVHTAFAAAPGRSRKPRIYGMITTAKGEDLAAILVREGLARVHGVNHQRPDGTSAKQYEKLLTDLQLEAAVKRRGAWKVTDVDHLPEIREEQRREERELKALSRLSDSESDQPIDLNTATEEELKSLNSIGAKLATRIIKQRPYKSVDDLTRVKGISPSKLEKLRPHVSVGNAANAVPRSGATREDR